MGSSELPPFSWTEAASNWQFAPVVTAFTARRSRRCTCGVCIRVSAAASGAALAAAPDSRRSCSGCWSSMLATQSGIGTYDDTLFWDHMIQHLMLIMIAPPLLVVGQPVTLLLHASRNPLHTAGEAGRALAGRCVWLTWPAFGVDRLRRDDRRHPPDELHEPGDRATTRSTRPSTSCTSSSATCTSFRCSAGSRSSGRCRTRCGSSCCSSPCRSTRSPEWCSAPTARTPSRRWSRGPGARPRWTTCTRAARSCGLAAPRSCSS